MSLKTPDSIQRLQKKLYDKAKQEPEYRFYLLYDKVHRSDVLEHAWRTSRSNGGAPGVDGVDFEDIEAQGVQEWLGELGRQLRNKTYRSDPVRRVMIPKLGGGERPLGIPTIRDRVVQTAAKLVLEPIFEADFEPNAYGYRPGRSALDAVREVLKALHSGYTDVVDADLSKYFDTIPHHELMKSVARRVVDRQMLKLIKGWLKVPVEEQDDRGNRRMTGGKKSSQGTPQGGVISPLLANIYMHRYLRAWRERGKGKQFNARIVNYADDFVILSRRNAAQALEWTRWAMGRMNLSLNETKTCVRDATAESFDFLGYTFGWDYNRKEGRRYMGMRPSRKSIRQVKQAVRAALRPGNHESWPEVVTHLNRILRGWDNYFGHGSRSIVYRAVDSYVYERARYFLSRRHKVSSRGTRRFPAERVFGDLGVVRLRSLIGRSA